MLHGNLQSFKSFLKNPPNNLRRDIYDRASNPNCGRAGSGHENWSKAYPAILLGEAHFRQQVVEMAVLWIICCTCSRGMQQINKLEIRLKLFLKSSITHFFINDFAAATLLFHKLKDNVDNYIILK